MNPPRLAWPALAGLLALAALVAVSLPRGAIDWQPGRLAAEPWRAWSAAFVHWSAWHLGANLAGCAVVGAFGAIARVPAAAAGAWLLAWPLTHLALLLRPDLHHFGGLSGVLHAGVAIVAVWLVAESRDRARWVGAGVLAGLAIKLVREAPWGPTLRADTDWNFAVAPLAHTAGAIAGVACAIGALLWRRARPRSAP